MTQDKKTRLSQLALLILSRCQGGEPKRIWTDFDSRYCFSILRLRSLRFAPRSKAHGGLVMYERFRIFLAGRVRTEPFLKSAGTLTSLARVSSILTSRPNPATRPFSRTSRYHNHKLPPHTRIAADGSFGDITGGRLPRQVFNDLVRKLMPGGIAAVGSWGIHRLCLSDTTSRHEFQLCTGAVRNSAVERQSALTTAFCSASQGYNTCQYSV